MEQQNFRLFHLVLLIVDCCQSQLIVQNGFLSREIKTAFSSRQQSCWLQTRTQALISALWRSKVVYLGNIKAETFWKILACLCVQTLREPARVVMEHLFVTSLSVQYMHHLLFLPKSLTKHSEGTNPSSYSRSSHKKLDSLESVLQQTGFSY